VEHELKEFGEAGEVSSVRTEKSSGVVAES
jgi:hypothetical protein